MMFEQDTLRASIHQAENGFVVHVNYPKKMLAKDPVLGGFLRIMKRGSEDPMKALSDIGDVLQQAQDPDTPLRKPFEEYVFADLAGAMKFVEELFSSSK